MVATCLNGDCEDCYPYSCIIDDDLCPKEVAGKIIPYPIGCVIRKHLCMLQSDTSDGNPTVLFIEAPTPCRQTQSRSHYSTNCTYKETLHAIKKLSRKGTFHWGYLFSSFSLSLVPFRPLSETPPPKSLALRTRTLTQKMPYSFSSAYERILINANRKETKNRAELHLTTPLSFGQTLPAHLYNVTALSILCTSRFPLS